MTVEDSELAAIEGEALVRALRRRYDAVEVAVTCGGREWRLLRPGAPEALIDEVAFDRDGRIPYWAEIWPSSQVLAGRIMAEPAAQGGLLELGSGVGLLSLAALAAGYPREEVVASDYHPEALDFVRGNAWLNDLPLPRTAVVDWRALPPELPRFARVVAADVLYEPAHADLVAAAVRRALAPGGVGVVADPGRRTAAGFAARCVAASLAVERERVPLAHEGDTLTIELFSLRRRD
ncbi:MAG: methyltransferase domain-containing protein [Myxococcales bacterium]|nr:methyltransferase domain-containing protein [Myxococcales bacterium]